MRLKPAPAPTPCLAPAETAGANKSRIEKTQAAVKAIINTSPGVNLDLGKIKATIATASPSNKYFINRVKASHKSREYSIYTIYGEYYFSRKMI
jgi:hypothetical protein